jgi:hypothetical protein
MRQYKDLAVKDPRMGVFNLNGLRADCKMSRWALRHFGSSAPTIAAIASTYGLYRVTSARGSEASNESLSIGAVAIANDMAWRLTPAAGFGQLTGDPFRTRMCGDAQPYRRPQ